MANSQPSQPYLGSGSKARTTLQGALVFGVGGLLGILLFPTPLGPGLILKHPWSMKDPWNLITFWAGPAFGGAVGGAWLGWVMRKKVRWATEGAFAFGIGFLPAALAMFTALMVGSAVYFMSEKQGMSGKNALLGVALLFILGFGISGAIAGALVFAGWRLVLASAGAFAAGGMAGGILISVGLLLPPAFRGSELLKLGMFAGIVVPYLLGGALLGAAVPGLRTQLRETAQSGPIRLGP
jgi:hypothetical protein